MSACQRHSLTARLRQRLDNFAKDRRGAAAVEFAMIAAPFFFLIFGLLEVCMIFIMSAVLDYAVYETSRPIRTGTNQAQAIDQSGFRNEVCSRVFNLLDCNHRMHIDVRSVDRFSSTPTSTPMDAAGVIDPDQFTYDPGGPNDIIAVRVFYEWSLITPIISMPLANMSGNRHLLQSAAVFRNEPFSSATLGSED